MSPTSPKPFAKSFMLTAMFSALLLVGGMTIVVQPTFAQGAKPSAKDISPDSAVFIAARDMVSNGDAERGRALIDSLLSATPEQSPRYADVLYWHAALSPVASASEKDYRRIIIEYPLSPRVPESLIRLGQLELQRGARDAALGHFRRVTTEYAPNRLVAHAYYWMARTLFEMNEIDQACAANVDAAARVDSLDVEFKNQIAFQGQRCRGLELATTPSPTQDSAPVEPAEEPAPSTNKKAPAKPATPPAKGAAAAKPPATPAKAPAATPAKAPAKAPAKSADEPWKFSVQVAAYTTKEKADELAASLRKKGYDARVDGTESPFRVRIGKFTTRDDATEMLNGLKAKQIIGFIVEG